MSQHSRRVLLGAGPVSGWERHGTVMTQTLSWETSLLQDPCLVYAQGGGPRFKMWYGSLCYVGYATSEDGVTWTKTPDPVLSRSLDSDHNLNQPSVVYLDGTWHMTYFGIDAAVKGPRPLRDRERAGRAVDDVRGQLVRRCRKCSEGPVGRLDARRAVGAESPVAGLDRSGMLGDDAEGSDLAVDRGP